MIMHFLLTLLFKPINTPAALHASSTSYTKKGTTRVMSTTFNTTKNQGNF